MRPVDPFEVLRTELRAQVVADPQLAPGELVERIVRSQITAPDVPPRRPGRRGRRAAGGGLVVAVLVGGGLAAAGLLRQGTVTQPQAGVACRAEASLTADAVVLGPQRDPVAACRELWAAGQLPIGGAPEPGSAGAVPPELSACINPRGAIEVIPVDPDQTADLCETLDLAPVGTYDATTDPLVRLQDAVVREVNSICVAPADAAERLEAVLARLGLEGWRIAPRDMAAGPCARVAIDAEERALHIDAGPPPGT